MKTKILNLLTLIVMMAGLSACTQNNGDISPWFGYWRMTALNLDGEPDPAYNGMITWSFQNNIVAINTYNELHDYDEGFGTWEEEGNSLILDFTHSQGQENAYMYTPPVILQIPDNRTVAFTIEKRSGREIVLSRVLDSGETMTCVLKKIY